MVLSRLVCQGVLSDASQELGELMNLTFKGKGKNGQLVSRSRKPLMRRLFKRPWYIELPMFATLVLLISPFNSLLFNFIVFHPDQVDYVDAATRKALTAQFDLQWTDESFVNADGKRLTAWYLKRPEARRTILISHGNAGNLSSRLILIAGLLHLGYSVFIYDYEGYGNSEGKPSPVGVVGDGLSAYDFEKGVSPSEVVLYGESLGCAVSSRIMERRNVAGAILQSPFTSIQAAGRDRLIWLYLFPDSVFPQTILDNRPALAASHPPVLLLHGQKDWILSADYSRQLLALSSSPTTLVLLPNCGHNDVFMNDLKLCLCSVGSFVSEL